eukprot:TRINITY_DN2138_c0_g1_i1.p1 TRINITY_DN2138_c0_g1~~TRINITY_DN2138_c0_g1_i1.p1  ORF type:complete len:207 (-),score=63.64 TRINITY_DN2138_c0_g1_i1:192-812(-)
MIRRPPRSTLSSSSAASDVYKRQVSTQSTGSPIDTMLSAFRGTVALRRCAQTVALDWSAISTKINTDSGRAELASLRMEIMEVNKALDKIPSGDASVDFAYWKTKIQTPGAVDQFEKAFNGLQVPVLEDTFTAALTSKFDAVIATAQEHAETSEARIKALEAEVEDVQAQKGALRNVSVEAHLAAVPELAAEIEAEIENNEWLVKQ